MARKKKAVKAKKKKSSSRIKRSSKKAKKSNRKKKRKKREHKMHGCPKCGSHWVGPPDQPHVCIAPSEERVFEEVDEVLLEAWEKLREFAADLGEQRIYPSQKAVMFARKICYFFVHPKKKYLQVSIFLKKVPKHPLVLKSMQSSRTRYCVLVRIHHADEVEAPLTDWIRESFESCSGVN